MTNTKMKLLKQIGSLALCLCMVVSCLPVSVFAEADGLCEHHHEHTAECGYVAAVEGQPCTHEHTDDCYSIVKCVHEHDENCGSNGENCTHVCSEASGCVTVKHNCHHIHDENCGYSEGTPASDCTHECGEECAEGCIHEHDDTCGYAEETEATPCNHICSIKDGCYKLVCSHAEAGQHDDICGYVAAVTGSPCKYECDEDHGEEETAESTETTAPAYTAEEVKAMIDALPDVSELESMSEDELNSIYEKAEEVYDAFETLTDEEQIELANDLVKLRDVLDFMTTQIQPLDISATYKGITITYWSTSDGCQKIYNASVELNGSELTLKFDIDWKTSTDNSTKKYTLTYTKSGYSCDGVLDEIKVLRVAAYTPSFRFTKSAGHYVTNWTSLDSTQHTGICEICGQTVTENHTGNATCSVSDSCSKCGESYINPDNHKPLANGICGCEKQVYQEAPLSGDVYQISNLGQLCWFANKVNNGETSINGILTADIDMENRAWTPIGTESQPYAGTFDGNGKTISNLSITATGNNQGLFGVVNGGTVKNFTVKGKINISETVGNIGGVVGYAKGKANIENVTAYVTISDTRTSTTARIDHVGGVVGNMDNSTIKNCENHGDITLQLGGAVGGVSGIAGTSSTITYCENYGTIIVNGASSHIAGIGGDVQTGTAVTYCINHGNVTSGGNDCVGGIVGYANENVKIEYCGNTGNIKSTYSTGGFVGGILGYINNNSFGSLKNCFNTGTITSNSGENCHTGAMVGWQRSNVSMISNNYYLDTSCAQASDGNAINDAYSRNADQFKSGEVAYLLNGKTNNGEWKQTIGSDNSPNFSGKAVYAGYICGSGNSDFVYRNTNEFLLDTAHPEHNFDSNGKCTYCGILGMQYDGNEQAYLILNLEGLKAFTEKVNGGEITINGKLMADIDASSLPALAIGVDGKAYSGTFDGNGYTLTIGLNSTAQYAAPFQYVNGATIKNLTVKGFITTNQKFAAGIVGSSDGKTTIENCLSCVTINSSVSGDGTHGGLVANVSSGTMTINNCGFIGKIIGSSTTNCGGLVGWSNGTTNISNSFVAADFTLASGENDNHTFSRNAGKVSLTNCYYLNALGKEQGDRKTADQFASGEVTWLLNGSKDNGTWKQTLKTDATPNFSGEAVYKTTGICEGYTNNETEKNRDHVDENGVCKYCGKLFDIVPAIWNVDKQAYEIYSAAQLVWFSKLVNGTLDGVDQKQFANAILMADIDMSVITDYVPIGGTTGLYYSTEGDDEGYQGIFDGNGHVIKNLSVKGSDANELTYGVFGTLSGTVKHLGVENFTFTLGSQDCRAGGIAGQVLSGGMIEDCYVANSIITATGKVAGGIAGCNYAGIIKNCFTYKVTVTATRTGGIVGDNCGDNNSDRKGTVINCYTDASNIESSARTGIVTNSTASVSVNDFASGNVGFELDGNRDLWKQIIGSQNYPTFSGNTIKVDGYNITTVNLISAKITWTAMEFTYSSSAGTWNPDTHSYSGGIGAWSPVDGGGTITVENTGADELRVKFKFVGSIGGISGGFDVPTAAVASGNLVESKLTVTGTPDQIGFNNLKIGSINVTLSKNITSSTWNVGDTVDWYGDDGQKYTCTVVSKSDSGYVLITADYVKTMTGNFDSMASDAAIAGARLPNSENSAELNFVQSEISKMGGRRIAVWQPSKSRNIGYIWSNAYEKYTYSTVTNKNYRIYYTFDVPID